MIRAADREAIAEAAERLRVGGLVAFPTETVYGLGARADDDAAVQRIYAAKGRPPENPTIAHVSDTEAAFELAASVSPAARLFADAFWPGPLTLVVPVRQGAVSRVATAGGDTVAVRVPVHPVARALLERVRLPIAAPSANRSTAISPTQAGHVEKSLGSEIFILDAGPTGLGIESTIVDVSGSEPVLLRRGSISLASLRALAPVADHSPRIVAEGARTKAPGGMARHYAPRIPLVCGDARDLVSPEAGRVGVIALGSSPWPSHVARTHELGGDPGRYAAGLYAALHDLEDDPRITSIFVEAPPRTPEWGAVWDRLDRARAQASS